MTDKEAVFGAVGEILGRRHRISGLDPRTGTFDLNDDDRAVRVTLEPDLLAEYFDRLGERDIPELSATPEDARDRLRVKRVVLWIEEIFEADISASLLEIRLSRSADGRISLVDRRGPARKSLPVTDTEGGRWSSDRRGT